jgi:hypothetical protein
VQKGLILRGFLEAALKWRRGRDSHPVLQAPTNPEDPEPAKNHNATLLIASELRKPSVTARVRSIATSHNKIHRLKNRFNLSLSTGELL